MRFLFSCLLLSFCFSWAQEEPLQEPQTPSAQEFYSYMQEAMDDENWWSAIDFAKIIIDFFPDSLYRQELPYFIGIAYYNLKQHELANEAFTEYLKNATSPKHFDEALQMKFEIANFFYHGGKKRLFGSHKLPAILSAQEDALQIYDEIVTTLPHHETAVRALFNKADIQRKLEEFKSSIESLQLLIRRFPKHELVPDAYLRINQVYLEQCKTQHLDPDLLDLAAANLRKLRLAYPRDPKIAEAESTLASMKELFAQSLLETGAFFLRRGKEPAAVVYFSKINQIYPNTEAAVAAREALQTLTPQPDEDQVIAEQEETH